MKQLILFILISTIHNHVTAQETGFLKFEFNVDSIVVVFDRDNVAARMIASGDSVELVTGTHIIEAYSPFDVKSITYRLVYKDSTRIIKYDFEVNNISKASITGNLATERELNANVLLMVDHDSEVYMGNRLLGAEFIKTNIPFKYVELTVRNPDFGSKTLSLNLEPGINVFEHYRRPSELLSKTLSVVPGASQIYKKQVLKGTGLALVNLGLILATVNKTKEYKDAEREFFSLRKQYNDAIDEERAFILGNLTEEKQDEVVKLDNQRRVLLGSTMLVYAYNVFDALTSKPKGGYRNDRPLRFYLSQEVGTYGLTNQATIQLNFGAK